MKGECKKKARRQKRERVKEEG